MGTYETYKTNKDVEETGAWVTMADGSDWQIRRATSVKAQAELKEAQRPYKTLIRSCEMSGRDLPVDIQDKINMDWTVNGLVTGFRKVTDPEGQPLEYSKDNTRTTLTNLPDLHVEIIQASARSATYKDAILEDQGKNS